MSNARLFCGSGSKYLAEKIGNSFGGKMGNINVQHFSDGEFGVEYKESIRGDYVF